MVSVVMNHCVLPSAGWRHSQASIRTVRMVSVVMNHCVLPSAGSTQPGFHHNCLRRQSCPYGVEWECGAWCMRVGVQPCSRGSAWTTLQGHDVTATESFNAKEEGAQVTHVGVKCGGTYHHLAEGYKGACCAVPIQTSKACHNWQPRPPPPPLCVHFTRSVVCS
jgi:hypothetical protein